MRALDGELGVSPVAPLRRRVLFLGSALVSAGGVATGIRSLERAVACPTSTKDMWKTLRAMYQATGASDRLAALDRSYRQRFGND